MTPPMNSASGAAEVVRGLTASMREYILQARKRSSGPGGEKWTLRTGRKATLDALVKRGLAKRWGVVSADLTLLGLEVRDILLKDNPHA